MLGRLSLLLTLFLISCATQTPVGTHGRTSHDATEIRYVSLDLAHVMVFSGSTARSGGLEAYAVPVPSPLLPNTSYPMRAFRTADNVQCVSVGLSGDTDEYAVRRPIRTGDRYTCLGTSFEVTHCTDDCRSAIIRVERPRAPDIGPFRTQLYVDSCRGLLIESDTGDLSESVPLDARLLRDPVGILADPSYPECNWF